VGDETMAPSTRAPANTTAELGVDETLAPDDPVPRAGTARMTGVWGAAGSGAVGTQTRAGQICGTPGYMSPEQWRSQTCTEAADVWALGVMLFEMLAARKPWVQDTLMALGNAVTGPEPAPALSSVAAVPQAVSDLVARCLSKAPSRRPAAAEVAAAIEAQLLPGHAQRSGDRAPFRGLLPFGEKDADLFFGRDAEVAAFVERLRTVPVVPVVGASGTGKSSFIQAGVVPRLKESASWKLISLRPGRAPFAALASRVSGTGTTTAAASPTQEGDGASAQLLARALHDSPERLGLALQSVAERDRCKVLLFVDQMEELFTLTEDDAVRRRFLQAVCTAADDPAGPVRVVFTLRDDFLGRLAGASGVADALGQVVVMAAPELPALREILASPVRLSGATFEDERLVDDMVAEVAGQPACLPLLQFAAARLWEERDHQRCVLTRSSYTAMGGVVGALARHADGILAGLSGDQVSHARQVLLQLVTPERTRRVVSRSALLEAVGADAQETLNRLVQGRIVVVRKARDAGAGDAELELVHESLIATWDKLSRWIDEGRDDLVFLADAGQAADLWDRRGRKEEEVWQGRALTDALERLGQLSSRVPDTVTAFLAAGRRRFEKRRRVRRLLAAAGLAGLAAITVASVLVALVLSARKEEADRQRELAQQKKAEAELRQAEALREGAWAALQERDLVEARAKTRESLELADSPTARALWWELSGESLVWRREVGTGIYDVELSADASTVLVGGQDGFIRVIDAVTGATRTLRGLNDQVTALSLSRDASRLASATWSGSIGLWQLADGTYRELGQSQGDNAAVELVDQDRRVAAVSLSGELQVFDAGTSKLLVSHRVACPEGLLLASFTPDGRRMAAGCGDGTARVYDVQTGAEQRVLPVHSGRTRAVAFSPDATRLYTGGFEGGVAAFDLSDGRRIFAFPAHVGMVMTTRVSPDGRRLATSGHDASVRLWDADTGAPLGAYRDAESSPVWNVSFDATGRFLVAGHVSSTLRLMDLSVVPRERPENAHEAAPSRAAFSPDGKRIATSGYDRTVRIWDAATSRTVKVLRGHTNSVWSVAWSPDGRRLASVGYDRTVRIWDADSGEEWRTLMGHTAPAIDAKFSPDGKQLATSGDDAMVRIWDVESGRSLAELAGHTDKVWSVAYAPDGSWLASGSYDRSIRVWDPVSMTEKRRMAGDGGEVWSVAASPDTVHLASGSSDGSVRIWDVTSGTVRELGKHDGRVYWLSYSPDGKLLGTPSSDGTIRLWDVASGQHRVVRGPGCEVNCVTFSPDGRHFATPLDDGTLRTWDTATGTPAWFSPALLSRPLALYSHEGWNDLATAGQGTAGWAATSWAEAVAGSLESDPSRSGSLVCVHSRDSRLEAYDVASDRRLFSVAMDGLLRVRAGDSGCVSLTGRGAWLHDLAGNGTALASGATAVALSGDEVLVATEDCVRFFDSSGRPAGALPTSRGATAVAATADRVVLGYKDGSIEVIAREAGASFEAPRFEGVQACPPVRIEVGPAGTLVAAYASGFVGLWSLESGERLEWARLHGAAVHVLVSGTSVAVATELGQWLTWDLGIFTRPRCDLLGEIWSRVPVAWEAGHPVRRAQPPDHECAHR
jgi:WD40 repeat protein